MSEGCSKTYTRCRRSAEESEDDFAYDFHRLWLLAIQKTVEVWGHGSEEATHSVGEGREENSQGKSMAAHEVEELPSQHQQALPCIICRGTRKSLGCHAYARGQDGVTETSS